MNILYVVSRPLTINSSSTIRNIATLKGMLQRGHRVTLITSKADRNHNAYDEALLKNLEGDFNIIEIKLKGIQQAARIYRKIKGLEQLKKVIYTITERNSIYDNLVEIVNHVGEIKLDAPYNIVISTSDPKSSHLFTYKLLKQANLLKKVPWIQIWGDPFALDITLKNKERIKQIEIEEKKLLGHADDVIYVSELTAEAQKDKYPEFKEKIRCIPTPYMKRNEYTKEDLCKKERVNLLYAGEFDKAVRDIIPICEAINQNKRFFLTICGNGNVDLKGYSNILVCPRMNKDRVEKLEEEADVLIHLSNKRGNQIPGKIYQYSGTNKPILFILDGEEEKLKMYFKKYNRYHFTKNRQSAIISALLALSNGESDIADIPVLDFSPQMVAEQILTYHKGDNNG